MRKPAQPLGAGRDSNRRCEERAGGIMDVDFSRIPVYGAFYRGPVGMSCRFTARFPEVRRSLLRGWDGWGLPGEVLLG